MGSRSIRVLVAAAARDARHRYEAGFLSSAGCKDDAVVIIWAALHYCRETIGISGDDALCIAAAGVASCLQ